MANRNLNAAKTAKKDEFYTEMIDIERELQHYWPHFKGKVVFCNCDDPYESNFFKYFALHFNHLGLKKLICTCYNGSPVQGNELMIDFGDFSEEPKKIAFKVEITEVKDLNGDGSVDLADVRYLLQNNKNVISILKTGDFRDPECIALLKEADVVVTNPPFSLFREYVGLLMEYKKKFLIIGHQNAITYKEFFPLLQSNQIWLGYGFKGAAAHFFSPYEDVATASNHKKDKIRVSGVNWFTNLEIPKRQEELDIALKEKQQYYEKLLQDTINQCAAQDEAIKEASETKWREAIDTITEYNNSIAAAKEKFESIERTLRTYDAEQQAKLFYTIQLPEEYYEDIEFLLTTVAAKVQHPDIISKLVWQEYVKPNLENTFKRIEIKSEPGIYKLTSLLNGKCYVGKSTNVKNRITDHFKSVVGITSIADQAVHHAIRKEGFWNWTIEIITYCEKEQLSDLEKYYIEFFKAQEFGYNKNSGG